MPNRLPRRRFVLSLALLAVVLLVAACGRVGTTPTTPTTPTTITSLTTTASPSGDPVTILSVTGPMPPFNPGGPTVKITVENSSTEPVVSLTATLALARSYEFDFGLSQSSPLVPAGTASATMTLIDGGISSQATYPMTVNGTLAGGQPFSFTENVTIAEPAS